MSIEKDVLLNWEEKKELYSLLLYYDITKRNLINHSADESLNQARREEFKDAKRKLEDFFDICGFELRFPGRDEITDFDLSVAKGMLVNSSEIKKQEVSVTATEKQALRESIAEIDQVLNGYKEETPWTDRDSVTIVAELKSMARKMADLIEKLEVIDLNHEFNAIYYQDICHK